MSHVNSLNLVSPHLRPALKVQATFFLRDASGDSGSGVCII